MVQNTLVFNAAASRKSRWKSFAVGYLVQAAMLAVLIEVAALHPDILLRKPSYNSVQLVAPVDRRPEPAPIVQKIQPPLRAPRPAEIARLAPPPPSAVTLPPPPKPQLPQVDAEKPTLRPSFPAIEVGDNKPPASTNSRKVQMDAFSGSSAKPTVNAPVAKVQTGGFGDPNGVPANPNSKGTPNIAQLGSFDLPAGAGQGNGSGGARGIKGTVASAGFGNGIASPVAGSGTPGGTGSGGVHQGGFGDASAAPAEHKARVAPVAAAEVPVEIISKPRPVYTDEARKLHIEGEVLLNVVFTAAGRLRVLGVERGLGHGLDEAAVQAAERMRYRPARRDGQPVDSEATVHIIFQLAES